MPFDPHRADAMRQVLHRRRGVLEKKMFGGVCWMLHGNMLRGVEVGRFMFRVGKALEAEALSCAAARPMDITGKPMRGLVWVGSDEALEAGLDRWVELAMRFVAALPPK